MIFVLFFLIILLLVFVPLRVMLLHPFKTLFYTLKDLICWVLFCKWRNMKDGYIYCFVALFGKGKTLASVNYCMRQYKRYNNKKVFDPVRKKWVLQKVNIISNVELTIPYVEFTSMQQIVNISKCQKAYDDTHDTLTHTLVLGDEFSVQLNSRQFKSNIDPLFLNTLLTCRHHHISIVYNAQRFNHVDALLRQVTTYVFDCNKIWRFMVHSKYDAWDLENASSPIMCKPIRRFGWFIRDKDYNAFDTLACVGNLTKSCESGDMLTEEQIISLQSDNGSDLDIVNRPSFKLRRRWKKKR